jgi:hypothetical protein
MKQRPEYKTNLASLPVHSPKLKTQIEWKLWNNKRITHGATDGDVVYVHVDVVRRCVRTRVTNGRIIRPTVIYEHVGPGWNYIGRGNPKTRRKTYHSATSSTTNPTWTEPDAKTGLRGERQTSNLQNHSTPNQILNVIFFWDIAQCNLWVDGHFGVNDHPDDESSKHIWNVGQFSRVISAIWQKTDVLSLVSSETEISQTVCYNVSLQPSQITLLDPS